jgi:hypothetical protein
MMKVVMARRKRLKKGGGDLEVRKQNLASLEQTIGKQNIDPLQPRLGEQNVVQLELRPREQNVVSLKLRIDESSNLCGLELTIVIVSIQMMRSFPIQIGNFDRKWWVRLF